MSLSLLVVVRRVLPECKVMHNITPPAVLTTAIQPTEPTVTSPQPKEDFIAKHWTKKRRRRSAVGPSHSISSAPIRRSSSTRLSSSSQPQPQTPNQLMLSADMKLQRCSVVPVQSQLIEGAEQPPPQAAPLVASHVPLMSQTTEP